MNIEIGPVKFKLTVGRIILLVLVFHAVEVAIYRFARGLGASTALSDAFPWGIWIGFDVASGVALAAGGFVTAAAVYVLNLKDFHPLARPAVLTGFLGYLLVAVGLLFDIGRPWNIWHPVIMWQPHSVMFEVAWCVMFYLTVLALEFSPALWERLGLRRLAEKIHRFIVPIAIAGVALSTLHQSSLGSLFLIMPAKLHPLWYSPLLPIFFYLSALATGPAMVTVESFLCSRAYGRQLEHHLLTRMSRFTLVTLSLYLAVKIGDLLYRDAYVLLFSQSLESTSCLIELGLGVVLPIILLSIPAVRAREGGLFGASALVVLGVVYNRLNVSITGMMASAKVAYFPTWMELSVSAGIVALGVLLYSLAVENLPVLEPSEHVRKPEPLLERLQPAKRRAWLVPVAFGFVLAAGLLVVTWSQNLTRPEAALAKETSPGWQGQWNGALGWGPGEMNGQKSSGVQPATAGPAPKWEGYASQDFADGCLTCHNRKGDRDLTVKMQVAAIPGHPQTDAETVGQCNKCHGKQARTLNRVLHSAHLSSKNYLGQYGPSCVTCHAMTEKGQMRVKGMERFKALPIKATNQDSASAGCVGCHILKTEAVKVKNHPLTEATTFAGCLACHSTGQHAFKNTIHTLHLLDEHYITGYNGSCLNCHVVNESGHTGVKGQKAP